MPPINNPKVLAKRGAESMASVEKTVAGLSEKLDEAIDRLDRVLHVIETHPELARSLDEESGPATPPAKKAAPRRKGGLLGGLGGRRAGDEPEFPAADDDIPVPDDDPESTD